MPSAYHSAILGAGREGNLALNWWSYSMMNLIRVAAFPASLTHHEVWCELSLDYPSAVESGQHIQSGWVHVGKAWWVVESFLILYVVCPFVHTLSIITVTETWNCIQEIKSYFLWLIELSKLYIEGKSVSDSLRGCVEWNANASALSC